MPHAENIVVIKRSIEQVYAFLADGVNNPKWRPGVVAISLKSGEAGQEGAIYSQTLKGPRKRNIAGDYQITVAKPGQELSFAVIAGPARPTGHYYLRALEDQTELRFVLDYQPKLFMRLLSGMIQKTMNSEVALLANLKQVLEAPRALG